MTLPHDAQITEKRGADVWGSGHGYFPGGVYTYEKTFTAPAEWADKTILLEFEGGELLAFGSANPCTEEQYHAGSFTTYYGRSLAIIRAGEARTVKISASDGRESASAQIRIM